jgi:hypothetical protein
LNAIQLNSSVLVHDKNYNNLNINKLC